MQTGSINIQPSELRNLAKNIAAQRDALNDQIKRMSQEMESLEKDGWNSDSGRKIRSKFAELRADYERKYPPAMEEYIRFLNKSADDYEAAESQRAAEIEKLRTSAT